MTRLLLPLLLLIAGYISNAEAATASATLSVSVTVVEPGKHYGQLVNEPVVKTADATAPQTEERHQSLLSKLNSIPYQRFAASDSANKRGELFP